MHRIDSFQNYPKSEDVRREEPDPSKAKGLIQMATKDMERVKEEKINSQSSSYVFKNAYDVIRKSITALMALQGYSAFSHKAVIAYARDRLLLPKSKISKLDRFRRLRNNIQYRAENANTREAKEIVEFMQEIVPEMEKELKKLD
ncbi:hypothetical protein AKJ56_01535 [candidate division MSBL1 archaeon SCGC-AAA382N08]|uniref:HEPN domain-containing protein n=1 Tax=candidate division MSBL1 archaeon SCGC-AAA382N08 TaxID=1698285 RepID=A0A133VPD1_9EURY|nr:hypothetical protein AKJ56_01535 [candidate division MSBL1 archaeon SCGC-AAA382N08]